MSDIKAVKCWIWDDGLGGDLMWRDGPDAGATERNKEWCGEPLDTVPGYAIPGTVAEIRARVEAAVTAKVGYSDEAEWLVPCILAALGLPEGDA